MRKFQLEREYELRRAELQQQQRSVHTTAANEAVPAERFLLPGGTTNLFRGFQRSEGPVCLIECDR